MRRSLAGFLALGVLVAAEPPKGDPSKKDLQRIQGDWALQSMVIDGAKASDDEAQSLFITVKDSEYATYLFSKALGKVTFKLDAAKKPKEIDLTPAAGPQKGKKLLGIYELKEDQWRICSAPPGAKRPTEFASKEGSGHRFYVWDREKK
jgi:uncharacterized protein (TIGR03067 family)